MNENPQQVDYYKSVSEFSSSEHFATFQRMLEHAMPQIQGLIGVDFFKTAMNAAKIQHFQECIGILYNEVKKAKDFYEQNPEDVEESV